MNNEFVYYMHDGAAAFRFQLSGDLSRDSIRDLEQARQTASSTLGARSLIVDLTGLTGVDAAALSLLEQWRTLGAQLTVRSLKAKERVQSMTGLPIAFTGKQTRPRSWFGSRAAAVLAAFLLAAASAGISTSAGMPAEKATALVP